MLFMLYSVIIQAVSRVQHYNHMDERLQINRVKLTSLTDVCVTLAVNRLT